MFSTLPFIALRTAVYFGCSLLLILGFVGGPALGVSILPNGIGFWGGVAVGGGAACWLVYFLREYFLYLVKAGHIAVLVELMEGRKLPKGQLSYAKDIVAERFVEASAFFVIDGVISGILGVLNRLLVGLGSFIPGMDSAMVFVGRVLRTSLTYADEVILALSFRTRSNDIWRTSRDGVVLYAQNYKTILKNAFFLAIINYVLVFVLFVLAWGPAAWIASLMPGEGSALIAFVVTLLLVYSLKKAFIEPFLMAALMQVYFHAIEGQSPNPAWTEKLDGLSEKFQSMTANFTNKAPDEIPSAVVPANQVAPVQTPAQQPQQWQGAHAHQWQVAPVQQWQAAHHQAPQQYQARPAPQAAPAPAPYAPAPHAPAPAQVQPSIGSVTLPMGLVNQKY
jgi:hypothetical protein